MATVPRISWNVRGIHDSLKSTMIFTSLRRYLPAICSLQETHLTPDSISCLKLSWVGWSYHSTHTSYLRGVSVLIHNSLDYQGIECVLDAEGRFVILLCCIFALKCILAFLYVPPPYNHQVLKVVLEYQLCQQDNPLYNMEDFNCYLDPALDNNPPVSSVCGPGCATERGDILCHTF